MSAIEQVWPSGVFRRRAPWLAADNGGESIIGFAFAFPILVALSLGILEFSLLVFDYHRAAEATRRGARLAAISSPVPDVSGFDTGTVIGCSSSGGTVTCNGDAAAMASVFSQVVADMRGILPIIAADNVEIEYRDSGIGNPDTPGGIIPLVTARLVGLVRPLYFAGAIPGLPVTFTLPPFTTNQVASGLGPTGS